MARTQAGHCHMEVALIEHLLSFTGLHQGSLAIRDDFIEIVGVYVCWKVLIENEMEPPIH